MLFEIEDTAFDGEVKVVRSTTFPDNRGSLTVTRVQHDPYCFPNGFIVRQMYTRSERHVLRGLHFQLNPPMGKLMQVINGSAYLVAVDIRPDSPTFLKYHHVLADDCNNIQVWAPAGFARGYYVFEPNTIVLYNCDSFKGEDSAIRWDDPDINISWPFEGFPILSERDRNAPTVKEYFS